MCAKVERQLALVPQEQAVVILVAGSFKFSGVPMLCHGLPSQMRDMHRYARWHDLFVTCEKTCF